ncbi:ADP-ribosylglycohydrolase family protein [Paenibacillus daejeonensis]|uniref:ADP-ribosylglycohydrolase family protein n=1 Tax=Paenibacillus daejeonensis TaxID=135193 RepID=UPI0003697E98|nr:ADP-ribosylglycohydrolase family protein [Paenibacillus daejeonensis]
MGIQEAIRGGLLGLAVGDALGVPVEFLSRSQVQTRRVEEMLGYGTHHQPRGTWSDDAALTFCLADSLCGGFNVERIAAASLRWYEEGWWSPHGEVFDIRIATRKALERLRDEKLSAVQAGLADEYSNGNGSLMRILPLAFLLGDKPLTEKVPVIAAVSSITHRHPRSIIACVIYVELAGQLLQGRTPQEGYKQVKRLVKAHYAGEPELVHYSRLLEGDISTLDEEEIASSGYVVHTLEAAVWCLLTSGSYEDAVLKAVRLGEDTDTTGAVTGGLAGLWYGTDVIPEPWLSPLARRDDIEALAARLAAAL